MKKMMINNGKCLFCDSPMELLIEVDTKFGKVYLCRNCCEKLYKKIGGKIIPVSPTNLFQNKNYKEKK